VLKAAMAAAGEPGGDAFKAIHQRHLEEGIRDVLAGKRVMRQSLFDRDESPAVARDVLQALDQRLQPGAALVLPLSILALVIAVIALVVAL